ncbi:N-acetylmuramoyl-L-alanine amidase [Streptococcus himalayensis]|uniref:N-acetylmuramoyl-L-alanine amidase n=2 Tax=Streptococcus himalayensis TaxID=1888195 RepID=A0A917EGT7_9STRE|nr:N-acetylmuramoyl-L-alanine amidase [Streptococcus himalayensis]
MLAFFVCFIGIILISKQYSEGSEKQQLQLTTSQSSKASSSTTTVSSSAKKQDETEDEDEDISYKPIIDVSGWQLPSEINYDILSKNISGAIVRVHSGAQTTAENVATYANGLDKSYKKHIEEFQKRDIPVAVYAYVAASTIKEMEDEAESFYKASEKYKPTYYWLDVEEKTMPDMNKGIEAFRKKLESLGAKKIGIYVGTYFIEEHSLTTDKFSAIWIPTYGYDNGYYNAAPDTDLDYDLHQYTSQGILNGFPHALDLNQLSVQKQQKKTFEKLFGS